MKVRTAELDDGPALAELSGQLGYPTSNAQAAERLGALLESEKDAGFVSCSDDDLVVGWIHVFAASRVESDAFAELGGFVVAEAHRGSGIGKALLDTAEDWAVEQGMGRLRVRSRSDRTDAHAFYERMGLGRSKEQFVFEKLLQKGGQATVAKTPPVAPGPTEEEKSYYKAYEYHSNLLRTWLVAYGIGGPVLFLNSEPLYKKLVASGQAPLIATLFLTGVGMQVLLSAVNKTIMWTLYYGAGAPDFRKTKRYQRAEAWSERFWIDLVADIASAVLMAIATFLAFRVLAVA